MLLCVFKKIIMSGFVAAITVLLFSPHPALSKNYGRKTFLHLEEICSNRSSKSRRKRPPLSLSQVVYQTVKAPQIEPVEMENRRPFDNYDLLRDKPAGIILKIKKKGWAKALEDFNWYEKQALENFNFSLSLRINGEVYNEISCSKNIDRKNIIYRPDLSKGGKEVSIEPKAEYCHINWWDVNENSIYKFIPLPTFSEELLGQYLGLVNIEIVSKLKYAGIVVRPCSSFESFTVNMLKPKEFIILFTGVSMEKCLHGRKSVISEEQMESYILSSEVKRHFYEMFPVSTRILKRPIVLPIRENNEELVGFSGSCKNKTMEGIFSDILFANELRKKYRAGRIFVVFTKDYLDFHNRAFRKRSGNNFTNDGFMYFMTPTIKIPVLNTFLSWKESYHVGFLKENTENKGVFLHELAHTLGQTKDFYDSKYYCSQFTRRGKPGERDEDNDLIGHPCTEYRIRGGLVGKRKTGGLFSANSFTWKLLNNQRSIMSDFYFYIQFTRYTQWIDRDTYQKALTTLENRLRIPQTYYDNLSKEGIRLMERTIKSINDCNSANEKILIDVSGIYNKETENLKDFKATARKISAVNDFSLTNSFTESHNIEESHIQIQLRKNKKITEELIFPVSEAQFKFFGKNDQTESKELNQFPVFGSFLPICGDFRKEDYDISVKEISMEGGVIKRKSTLLDFLSIKWEKEDEKNQSELMVQLPSVTL